MSQQNNILIIDDEPTIRRVINMKLTKEGYSCDEAENADSALEKLKNSHYQLVILDIMMPGKSGIELLPEIKTAYPDTFVIMVTAVADLHVAVKCMKEGAHDYLSKPFEPEELVQVVRKTLDKRSEELKRKDRSDFLENKVTEQTNEIRKLSLGAIESLVNALESKDKYTAGHSRRVALISNVIGKTLNLRPAFLEDLHRASLLHDVGKIAIDPRIQNKPGKLTPGEYELIKTHSKIGAQIVKPLVNDNVTKIIECHHMSFNADVFIDGKFRSTPIPLGARIIAIADAYDAMTSDRPYRRAMPVAEAIKEIQRCNGTQFDPNIVAAFVNLKLCDSIQTPEYATSL